MELIHTSNGDVCWSGRSADVWSGSS